MACSRIRSMNTGFKGRRKIAYKCPMLKNSLFLFVTTFFRSLKSRPGKCTTFSMDSQTLFDFFSKGVDELKSREEFSRDDSNERISWDGKNHSRDTAQKSCHAYDDKNLEGVSHHSV